MEEKIYMREIYLCYKIIAGASSYAGRKAVRVSCFFKENQPEKYIYYIKRPYILYIIYKVYNILKKILKVLKYLITYLITYI